MLHFRFLIPVQTIVNKWKRCFQFVLCEEFKEKIFILRYKKKENTTTYYKTSIHDFWEGEENFIQREVN